MTSSNHPVSNPTLAASITRAASSQTYYTIRLLADRDLVSQAYQAYAYFRWLDDKLDQNGMNGSEKTSFVHREKNLIEQCYRGVWPHYLASEEELIADLIRHDRKEGNGLHAYIYNMMAVMEFDAERRGRWISQEELNNYTRWLAIAVTEALHYFIGHDCVISFSEGRYMAVTAAHIIHMLRDTTEDIRTGYFNIPSEYLREHNIQPDDFQSAAYRKWVHSRVLAARTYFNSGRDYLAQVPNFRCRLACFAYVARFESLLDTIEQDGYRLRYRYPESNTHSSLLRMFWSALSLALYPRSSDRVSGVIPI